MNRRFDLIVFDWDGTLFDSTMLIARCIQNACADVGAPVPSDGDAAYVIGLGEMYVADPRFGANYATTDGGTTGAEFVRDALRIHADTQL